MTILFLGSGPFGIPALERLASERAAPLHVGTVPDAPRGRKRKLEPTVIKKRALELGLPVHERATLRKEHGASLIDETGATLVITADFRLMLPVKFLEAPPRGCFNLHGSLLPRWRGAAPIVHGVLAGDDTFGVTLYRMVKALDAGPVVEGLEVDVPERPTAPDVETRVSMAASELIAKWTDRLLAGDVPLQDQDESAVTIAPKIEKPQGAIEWSAPPAEIDRQIRALAEWPRTWSHVSIRGRAERLFLDVAEPGPEPASPERGVMPGEIVELSDRGFVVACGPSGAGRIEVIRVQRAGKNRMDATEFCRGAGIEPGVRLGSEEAVQPPDEEPAK